MSSILPKLSFLLSMSLLISIYSSDSYIYLTIFLSFFYSLYLFYNYVLVCLSHFCIFCRLSLFIPLFLFGLVIYLSSLCPFPPPPSRCPLGRPPRHPTLLGLCIYCITLPSPIPCPESIYMRLNFTKYVKHLKSVLGLKPEGFPPPQKDDMSAVL